MNIYRNLKISKKMNLIVFSSLILFALIVGLAVIWKVDTTIRANGLEKVKGDLPLTFQAIDSAFPGDWRAEGDQLFKGDTLLNNNTEIIKYIEYLTNNKITIFLHDTRVATNILNDGKPAIGTKANEIVTKETLQGGKTYFGEVEISGQKYQSGYLPIKDSSGEIIGMWYIGASQDIVDEVIADIFWVIVISSIVLLLISFVFVWLFTNSVRKRLHAIAQALEHAGNGDFSIEVTDKNGDEIGQLANSYMLMREKLSRLIHTIIGNSEQVAAAAEELNASSEETSTATDSITHSILEVATSGDDQKEYIKSLENTSSIVLHNINEISQVSQSVLHASELNAKEAAHGGIMMNKTMQQVNVIDDTTKQAAQLINHLGDKSQEIDSIINIITAISEQTNLLALNAAIEAARAGEHGRGFAVVADEVRQLAEQSNQSANQIRQLIGEIQRGIKDSISSMEDGRSAISEGLELASQAQESLTSINESVQDMFNRMQSVSSSIEEIKLGTKEMDGVVQSTVELIENTSGLTQTVAASAEEQSAAMQEVAASAHALSHLSVELADSVNSFKLK